jgi:hypothetical protein
LKREHKRYDRDARVNVNMAQISADNKAQYERVTRTVACGPYRSRVNDALSTQRIHQVQPQGGQLLRSRHHQRAGQDSGSPFLRRSLVQMPALSLKSYDTQGDQACLRA